MHVPTIRFFQYVRHPKRIAVEMQLGELERSVKHRAETSLFIDEFVQVCSLVNYYYATLITTIHCINNIS